MILAEIIGNKLNLIVYLDMEPTVHEKDVYYSYCSEILGEFVELKDSEVHFFSKSDSSVTLKDKIILFARCDYLDFDGNLIVEKDDEE